MRILNGCLKTCCKVDLETLFNVSAPLCFVFSCGGSQFDGVASHVDTFIDALMIVEKSMSQQLDPLCSNMATIVAVAFCIGAFPRPRCYIL